ncbi:ATP-binding protein [Pelotomaculum terephthalicicum JT]|uniref:ATP-binding protein n=1 Tax=Pelotomaculum TaxID=191373 RepID=UPI0009D2BF42|nr:MULTISPECIES: ATP-binding protein [Pelotomaculum]MCG9967250.1 ATP-binding protein [Pelotomaculum terephthalicicum JT]OPX88649.1 MAG: Primosomal protein DnaI [Pelotomaculum sp. PtaB.Bin117]OPY63575.1 MAG: Primosomal protein DnaI [Pelotomaculum sp. PtaU1.Bin065]
MGKACDLCGDRGIILQGDVAVPCSCGRQKAIARLFRNSCLPQKLLNCSLANFNFKYYARDCVDESKGISYYELAQLAYQAAKKFIAKFLQEPRTDGLMFTGQVGSGKTFLACSIANALLKRGKTALFVVVPDLLDQIRSTYDIARNAGDYTEFDLVETARQVPLLILDDLGAHNYTEWSRNKIYSIINYRLNHCLPIIVTTNITPEDLEEYLGERTTSRLLEMCKPYRLLVDIDIRAVQRKERD